MATGFPVKANYATGDVLTAANMNDLSGTLNYLNGVPYNKNAVINGALDIWQRGTSFAATATTVFYTADRWCIYANAVTGRTISQQNTPPTGYTYSIRVQRDSGNTNTQNTQLFQIIESSNMKIFQGQYVTVSFWAKVGANYSPSGGTLSVTLYAGTGTDQNPYTSGYTGQTTPISTTVTPTTSWARYSVTTSAALATSINELTLAIASGAFVGTAGTNDWFEITGVQLEAGSTATPFSRAGGTIQGELAACQRYFYTTKNGTTSSFGDFGGLWFYAYDTGQAFGGFSFPVTMRTSPTVSLYGQSSGTAGSMGLIGTGDITGVSATIISPNSISKIGKTSGWVAGNQLAGNCTASAEL